MTMQAITAANLVVGALSYVNTCVDPGTGKAMGERYKQAVELVRQADDRRAEGTAILTELGARPRRSSAYARTIPTSDAEVRVAA